LLVWCGGTWTRAPPAEIEAAVADWREERFGTMAGYHDDPLAATFGLPQTLRASAKSRILLYGPDDQSCFWKTIERRW
jgi:hypothetical protein